VLNYLDEINTIVVGAEMPFLLVIFPHSFQIGKPELQQPQGKIREYARSRNIDYIDVTPVF